MAIGTINGFNNDNNSDFKLTLSQYCLTLDKDETTTVTVTSPSDGQIYAVSSNTNIATVSVSNNIITINSLNEYGSSIISIGQSSGTGNYVNITPDITQIFVLCQRNISTTLNSNSWETISEISIAGNASNYWSVGDTKDIILNGTIGALALDNFNCKVFILHFNYPINNIADNNIIFGCFKDNNGTDIALIDSNYYKTSSDGTLYFNMNHWRIDNTGGWQACDLRYDILGATSTQPSEYGNSNSANRIGYNATSATLINPKTDTLLAALPSDLRSVLKL